jgi:hypothetical protein
VSQINEREGAGTKPTFDLLPLQVEGLARFLGLLPQVTDRGLLLLEGLAQVLVQDAELDQLPVEVRGLVFPLLEGRLRPLEHGALLLELTQRLFSRQEFPLECSPGLGKGSPLLLKLGLHLLACGLLLMELLLRRGKRGGLVRQGRPQPLGLLVLLLGLTLPSPRPLEGRAVLLKLGTSGGHLGLPLRRHGARPASLPAPCAAPRPGPLAPPSPS